MASWEVATGTLFLAQVICGILGNFSLLSHHVFLSLTGFKARSTDLILRHLLVANCLNILSYGVPQEVTALRGKFLPSDAECNLLFYVRRVSRAVSIESTCFLSIFQAITISPRNSRWAGLKVKAPRYIGLSSMLCWILNMFINTISPIYVTSKWINTSITKRKDYGYCNAVFQDTFTGSLFLALLLLPDAVSLGLMLLASSSMVFILHRHKQQVQHIHGTHASPRTSPESRATRSILALVSTFVFFYVVSSTFQVYLALLSKPSQLTVNISALFAGCFLTLSPYLLMSCDSRVSTLCFASIRNTESPNIIRNMCLVFAL
ncbi:vomeronasal 1 receptor oryCunV1R1502 [Oryctolagus cuniculus]|uniref:vomeronasal 1 receptor oryCunV1R1502 n=1 Tax=Oryctolagus cuniculus TaxID=9986 RepID=UPI0001D134FC|nr:vomeronasal 1 receptor oryCunV1R1502 [Oryctolagus cuniculus]